MLEVINHVEWVEIINVVKEAGTTVAVVGVVIYLLVKYFSMLIESKIPKKEIPEEASTIQYNSVKCLKTLHPYFDKIDRIIDIKLPITSIGGPVRTEIFRDILNIYYKTSKEKLNELLNQDITLDNFLTENYRVANSIIKESNEKMLAQGIPEVVIRKFNEWNNGRNEYILSAISDIDSSNVFGTVVEKQYTVLSTYVNLSNFILMDAEKTLKSLNGDLTGAKYKDKIVESLYN